MKVDVYPDQEGFVAAVVEALTEALDAAIRADGAAVFAASGGTTPIPVYERLALAPIDWKRVEVVPTDERCVPDGDPESNRRMLLERLGKGSAFKAGFSKLVAGASLPSASVALIGMGADGHFASLFPHSPALAAGLDPACEAVAVSVPAGVAPNGPPQARVSYPLAALAKARTAILAFTGRDKADTFARALQDGDDAELPVRALLRRVPGLRVMRAD